MPSIGLHHLPNQDVNAGRFHTLVMQVMHAWDATSEGKFVSLLRSEAVKAKLEETTGR